jgi:5-methylcytosine-specific restriction endonuclease McrA
MNAATHTAPATSTRARSKIRATSRSKAPAKSGPTTVAITNAAAIGAGAAAIDVTIGNAGTRSSARLETPPATSTRARSKIRTTSRSVPSSAIDNAAGDVDGRTIGNAGAAAIDVTIGNAGARSSARLEDPPATSPAKRSTSKKRRRRRAPGELPKYVTDAPHRHAQRIARHDLPRGFCRVCTLHVQPAKNGRVRSWHDGRPSVDGSGLEPNCLHRYKIAQRRSYALNYLVKRDGRTCARCKATRGKRYAWLHVDHIVPLADGGANDESNLQLLCPDCHKTKTATEAGARAARKRNAAAVDAAGDVDARAIEDPHDVATDVAIDNAGTATAIDVDARSSSPARDVDAGNARTIAPRRRAPRTPVRS